MNIKKILLKNVLLLKARVKKIKKRSIYCIVAGLILSVISFLTNKNSIYESPYEIARSSYGTQKTPYNLHLSAENLDKDMEFSVSVSSRRYEKEEADKKFSEKMDELIIGILGENESLERINSKLNFSSDIGDGIKASFTFEPKMIDELYEKYGAKLENKKDKAATDSDIDDFSYYVKYQNVIDGSGNVKNENFKVDEFCTGYINVQLSTEIKDKETPYKSEKYMLPVRIESKPLSTLEAFRVAFKKEFEEKDKDSISDDTIKLPKVVNNFRIRYKEKRNLSFLLMPFCGILVAILLEAKDKEKERDAEKKRIRRLEIDYTQIITKVLLYVSSSMTIRNAMIRLAERYQSEKNKLKSEKRVAYEELIMVKNKLNSGYGEIRAYEEMAQNINMRIYTRFLNIVIQSIKNGNKELKNILNMEVQDALYERKQHAKKLGEEAATKLILPLMIMLAIIMVIIMVPAFMGM